MAHWHRLEITLRDHDDYVHLYPPALRYEDLRAQVQSELDAAVRYPRPGKLALMFAETWRDGTERPPDTLIRNDEVTALLHCDNECPREAQIVLDDIYDSMGRKAPRITRWHAENYKYAYLSAASGPVGGRWPEDFLGLFDDPEPPPHRPRRRRRS